MSIRAYGSVQGGGPLPPAPGLSREGRICDMLGRMADRYFLWGIEFGQGKPENPEHARERERLRSQLVKVIYGEGEPDPPPAVLLGPGGDFTSNPLANPNPYD